MTGTVVVVVVVVGTVVLVVGVAAGVVAVGAIVTGFDVAGALGAGVMVVVAVVVVWGRAMVVGAALVTEGTKAGMLTAMTLPSARVALTKTV